MGKKVEISEDTREYIYGLLIRLLENDIEFYEPENKSKKKSNKIKPVVKLFNYSNDALTDEFVKSEVIDFNEHCIKRNHDNDLNAFFKPSEGTPITRRELEHVEIKEKVSSSFKEYVFKKLTERLNDQIKWKDFPEIETKSTEETGIYLIKSSTKFIERLDEPDVVVSRYRSVSKRKQCGVGFRERLVESAVTSDWVLNKIGTEGWTQAKRPKVVCLKLVKSLSDGALECHEVQSS